MFGESDIVPCVAEPRVAFVRSVYATERRMMESDCVRLTADQMTREESELAFGIPFKTIVE